jgi:hypothetical protein
MRVLTLALAAAVAVAAAPAAAQDIDRADAWRKDLALAKTEFLDKDRSYSPTARAAAERLLADLSRDAPKLDDVQMQAGLARLAALSGNAHTRAYLLRNRGVWTRFPVRIWKFADGWRVVAARPSHADLVGARVVRVGGLPVAAAEARVRPLFAGNDNWAEYMAGYSLTSLDALAGAGLPRAKVGLFEFETQGRRIERRLARDSVQPPEDGEENWWFLSPAHSATKGWVQALQDRALPPVLEGADEQYRFIRCGEVGYLQLNRADDSAGGTLRAFGEQVLAELERDPPRRLLVDLRFNTGGDLTKGWPFFRSLAQSALAQEPGRTVVIVGPNTFSAGISHMAQMRQFSKALVVGTEPGDVLETWAEGDRVRLPHSKILMRFTTEAHTYSRRPSGLPKEAVHLDLDVEHLLPDVPADWSWAEYAAGRDPYVERVLGAGLGCPPTT